MLTLTPKNTGWIELICGPMFGGKTEELIRRLRRVQYAKQPFAIFKPVIDNRYSDNYIVSHDRAMLASVAVEKPHEILAYKDHIEVVGIDEAQFFDDSIVAVTRRLAESGKRVIIAGLEKDYRGQSFGPMPQLLIEAEYVSKVLSICVRCGNPASFTQRISQETGQIVVGEKDKYEARCRKCYEPLEERQAPLAPICLTAS